MRNVLLVKYWTTQANQGMARAKQAGLNMPFSFKEAASVRLKGRPADLKMSEFLLKTFADFVWFPLLVCITFPV